MQERPYHQALGILLNSPEAVYMGPNPRAFGLTALAAPSDLPIRTRRLGFLRRKQDAFSRDQWSRRRGLSPRCTEAYEKGRQPVTSR